MEETIAQLNSKVEVLQARIVALEANSMSTVVHVVETISTREVNLYLDAGWILLTTGQFSGDGNSALMYSLGWPRTLGKVIKPQLREQSYYQR